MRRLLGLLFFAFTLSAQYIPPGGSSGGPPTGAAGNALAGSYPNPSLATLAQDLLFTDATYDMGKLGATRPRDGFFSRNLNVGSTITIDGTTNGLTVGSKVGGVLLSSLTGLGKWTAGVPGSAAFADVTALWSSCTGLSTELLAANGGCATFSTVYTGITGVPTGAVLGNSTNATANAQQLPGVSYLIAANVNQLSLTGGSSQSGTSLVELKTSAGASALSLKVNGGVGAIGFGCQTATSPEIIANGSFLLGTRCDETVYNTITFGALSFEAVAAGVFGWSLDTFPNSARDTGLSRIAAGAAAVGTGAQGSIAGTLQSGVVSADPGCTTTGHIGKWWFDITTTTTALKTCLNVAGTLTWVVK